MESATEPSQGFVPLGTVEPHASLLTMPDDEQLLFKVMTTENFVRSVEGGYLHFNRVDSYHDFPAADQHDGEQSAGDRSGNALSRSEFDPEFSAADYYDRCRSRTYACCFSLQNTPHLWETYGSGALRGKVGLVFNFGKLRARVNRTIGMPNALRIGEVPARQIFSVNYGIIIYTNWNELRMNELRLPNPIQYTYLKDENFQNERELRVSLSALGIGEFATRQLGVLAFPSNLQLAFDFRQAATERALMACLHSPDCDVGFLHSELKRLRFEPSDDARAG